MVKYDVYGVKNMKKKIIVIVVIIILVISLFVPVKSVKVWVNDDKIAEVGHYETHYYNIYGITINKSIE